MPLLGRTAPPSTVRSREGGEVRLGCCDWGLIPPSAWGRMDATNRNVTFGR